MKRPPDRTVVTQCERDSTDCQSALGRASTSAPLRGTRLAMQKNENARIYIGFDKHAANGARESE
jgi:hypothetical protein